MTERRHNETVPYADVVVPGASIDLDGWECWTHHDGITIEYYARGPCPSCGAQSQGRLSTATAPIESLGEREPREPPPSGEPVEVAVRCACGSTHGRDGAKSCGRRWSILCPSAES